MRHRNLILGLSLLAAVCPAEAHSQASAPEGRVFVTGRIVDQTNGRGLRSARVAIYTPGAEGPAIWVGLTRSTGQFEVADLPSGVYELRVSLLSFKDIVHEADLREGLSRDFQVSLVPNAIELEPIVAVASRRTRMETSGFYDRQQEGVGLILDREGIADRGVSRVSDLFYSLAGVRVVPARRPGQPSPIVMRNQCIPQIVMDGVPLTGLVEIDDIARIGELEAIEIHVGMSSPVRYSSTSCGTVMLWTRELAPGEGRPFTLARGLGAAGLVLVVFLVSR